MCLISKVLSCVYPEKTTAKEGESFADPLIKGATVKGATAYRCGAISDATIFGLLTLAAGVIALSILFPPLAIPAMTGGVIAIGSSIGLSATLTAVIVSLIGVPCLIGSFLSSCQALDATDRIKFFTDLKAKQNHPT